MKKILKITLPFFIGLFLASIFYEVYRPIKFDFSKPILDKDGNPIYGRFISYEEGLSFTEMAKGH